MQLVRTGLIALVVGVALGAATPARADDTAEASTSVFAEKRDGGKGGLTVIHPQLDLGVDLGRYVTLAAGYSADAVSGATATTYSVDAVSTATKFSDFRQEGDVGLGFQGRQSKLSFNTSYSTERDYLSRSIGGAASVDLAGRNTTMALAYSHSWDQACDKDNGMATPLDSRALLGSDPCMKSGISGKDDPGITIWKPLSIDTAQVTLTQNLSPTLNMQIAAYGQVLDGFQSNPYRSVDVGGVNAQEYIPNVRARWSVTARVNRYLPKLHGAVHFGARFYDDTWHVIGGDVELAYSQYIGDSLLLRIHARVYQQTAAAFFKDAFYYLTQSTAGAYYTGDRELSPVRNAMVGAKLTLISLGGDKKVWHLFDKLQLNLKGDVLFLDNLAADDTTMNTAGIGQQFIYGNSIVDAVVIQLGVLGNY